MEFLGGPLVLLLVAVAGGIGAVIRLFAAEFQGKLPWGILLANVSASFVVGLMQQSPNMILAMVVISGFAGGLSTFSTFAAQTTEFIRRGRIAQALLNTLANILLSSTAVWLGALVGSGMLK